jgi:hypothetical protein
MLLAKASLGIRTESRVLLQVTLDLRSRVGEPLGVVLGQHVDLTPWNTLRVLLGVRAFSIGPSAPIYGYERDVRLQHGWLSLTGGGTRFFLLASFMPFGGIEVQVKYAQTAFAHERELGSGVDYVRTRRIGALSTSIRLVR